MHARLLTLVPVLASSGCLARDISNTIDNLHCSASLSGSTGTTGDCPDSSSSGDTGDTGGIMTSTGGPPGETTTSTASTTDATGSTGSTGETGSTTDAPMVVCGDGVIDAGEDCDDANDIADDGCSDCGRERLVFITSDSYQGGIFDGLVGADQRCKSLAGQAMLPNFTSFKAWLSDSQVSARDRLFAGRGRYVLVNGLVVADSWDALLAGELQNPINVTELSETQDVGVHTGTRPDGTAVGGVDYCADWFEHMLANEVHWGISSEISANWTLADVPFDQPGSCNEDRALYCFEQQ